VVSLEQLGVAPKDGHGADERSRPAQHDRARQRFRFEEDAMRSKRLTVQQKKEIFLALVAAQDTGLMTVAQSQEHVAQEFDITEAQLRQIIEEGLEKEWPPLNEAVQEVG
jgi:hypothetical protein